MTENKAKKRTIMDEEERKFYENLGSRLRNYINHYNISLEYVKKIMKVHRETVYMTLDGRRKLSALELLNYSKLFKVSIDELVDNDPKYYLDEAFIKEYQKLSIEDKKEMYDFCRFKNSLRDGAEIKEEISKNIEENNKEDIA